MSEALRYLQHRPRRVAYGLTELVVDTACALIAFHYFGWIGFWVYALGVWRINLWIKKAGGAY